MLTILNLTQKNMSLLHTTHSYYCKYDIICFLVT